MKKSSVVKFAKVDAHFGIDRALEIDSDCHELGITKPMIVGTSATEHRYTATLTRLDGLPTSFFLEAESHSPAEVIDRATERYRNSGCDAVITIGGGSSISIGKALSVTDEATFIALPTTYSGSEATAIFGRRIDGEKRTAIDDSCRPTRIIYDPVLSCTLPLKLSVTSATNCMAHAIDALYAKDAGVLTETLARQALEILRDELPKLTQQANDLATRERLLVAGFLGGTLVSMHGIALHHQLCHVIGGLYGTSHGENNAAVLPQAVAYNTGAVPRADKLLSEVFGGDHPAGHIFDLIANLIGDTGLSNLGIPEDAAETITAQQLSHAGYNPKPLQQGPLKRAVHAALQGSRPEI